MISKPVVDEVHFRHCLLLNFEQGMNIFKAAENIVDLYLLIGTSGGYGNLSQETEPWEMLRDQPKIFTCIGLSSISLGSRNFKI